MGVVSSGVRKVWGSIPLNRFCFCFFLLGFSALPKQLVFLFESNLMLYLLFSLNKITKKVSRKFGFFVMSRSWKASADQYSGRNFSKYDLKTL